MLICAVVYIQKAHCATPPPSSFAQWGYGGGGWLPPMGRNFREYYKVFSVAMMGGRSDSRAAELEKGGKSMHIYQDIFEEGFGSCTLCC
jgi:hypothetical protein